MRQGTGEAPSRTLNDCLTILVAAATSLACPPPGAYKSTNQNPPNWKISPMSDSGPFIRLPAVIRGTGPPRALEPSLFFLILSMPKLAPDNNRAKYPPLHDVMASKALSRGSLSRKFRLLWKPRVFFYGQRTKRPDSNSYGLQLTPERMWEASTYAGPLLLRRAPKLRGLIDDRHSVTQNEKQAHLHDSTRSSEQN